MELSTKNKPARAIVGKERRMSYRVVVGLNGQKPLYLKQWVHEQWKLLKSRKKMRILERFRHGSSSHLAGIKLLPPVYH